MLEWLGIAFQRRPYDTALTGPVKSLRKWGFQEVYGYKNLAGHQIKLHSISAWMIRDGMDFCA